MLLLENQPGLPPLSVNKMPWSTWRKSGARLSMNCCGSEGCGAPPSAPIWTNGCWRWQKGPAEWGKKWCEMICFITITLMCQKQSKRQMWRWVCRLNVCNGFFQFLFLLAGIFLLGQSPKIPNLGNTLSRIKFIMQGGSGGGMLEALMQQGDMEWRGLAYRLCSHTATSWVT